jgi:F-type H+-transporting ATPase subunit a
MNPLLASGANPLGHVLDKESAFSGMFGTDVKLSVVSLVVGAVIALAWLLHSASRIRIGPASEGHDRWVTRGRGAQVVEVLVEGLYGQMLEPVMGARLARAWLPFLLSLFFFVLVLNLMGLVPLMDVQEIVHGLSGHGSEEEKAAAKGALLWIGGTATASLSVNMALALWAFLAIQWQSVRELGVKGTLEHLCGGHELVANKGLWFVVPIIFVVEVLGMVIKPAALAIRLFANMVGGHTLMATLMMFGAMAGTAGLAMWSVGGISLLAGGFAVIITFLELFVAFLQAFVFMFLTAVFISQMAHHGEHHDEEHGHDGHHGSESAEAHSPGVVHGH